MKFLNTLMSLFGLSNAADHWKFPEDWNFCGPDYGLKYKNVRTIYVEYIVEIS